MTPPSVIGIVVAAIGGAAVGTEREWSGHAKGPAAHFAGVRTFTLLGGLGGLCGWLWLAGFEIPSAVLVAGAVGLIIAAYVAASRHDVDGTTETAALVVVAAGVSSGAGHIELASAVVSLTCLLLVEKTRLHAMVERINDRELRAGFRFGVLAIVVLPLLPEGPYGPLDTFRPRLLWAVVLFFSGLSFAGYIARRLAGARSGYPVAGLLGGLISSTSVAFAFARTSREEATPATPLAVGVLGACTVMFLRIVVATAVLNPDVALAEVRLFAAPFAVGVLMTLAGFRRTPREVTDVALPDNPLQLGSALQMALLFQVVIFGVAFVRTHFTGGLAISGAVLGLTDVDALTISMARAATDGASVRIAAEAIAAGALSNTVLKGVLAAALGTPAFRRTVLLGLAALGAALAASLIILR